MGILDTVACKDTSRRRNKSFLIQQFFKNVGEVWASIFEKLLHRKTFQLPAACILQPIMFHLVFDSLAS